MSSHHMLTRVVRRSHCNAPLPLHFLYNTSTLRRFYSEIGRDGEVKYEPTGARDDSSAGTPHERPYQPNHSYKATRGDHSGARDRKDDLKRYNRPSARSRYSSRFAKDPVPEAEVHPQPWMPKSTRPIPRPQGSNRGGFVEEHVPFETPEGVPAPISLDSTTISSDERKAFERLRKLGAAKQSGGDGAGAVSITSSSARGSETLDDILEEAMSMIDAERFGPVQAQAIAGMRRKELTRLSQLFRDANTDIELWGILEKEVLKPIAALDLDNPAAERAERKTSPVGSKKAPGPEPIRADSRDVLMHNFPFHLSLACRTLQNLFPRSPLVPAIIPTIRHMGPSVYALGVSTKLYNQLIGYTLNNLTDMEKINEYLQQMEDEVIEPDRTTLNILNDITLTWQAVRRGAYGEAARVAWETERFRKSLTEIVRWATQIQTSVQEREADQLARENRAAGLSDGAESA